LEELVIKGDLWVLLVEMSRSLEDVENIDRDKRRQFDKETKDYLNTKLSELKLNLHDMRSKIEIKSYF